MRTAVVIRAGLAAFAAVAFATSAVAQQGTIAPHSAQIDRNGVLILVRSTLLALDDANKTGNYTVLRDLAAPSFAAANTAAKLGDIFASNRASGLDLSGVAVLDPQLTLLPEIEKNGMMRMTGFFPSVPKQVNFDLLYAPVAGQWRLFGISLSIGPSGPVAPAPPVPSASAKTADRTPTKHRSIHVKKPDAAAPTPDPN